MKNIYILGALGSIGSQTLEVIRRDKKNFKIIGISFGRDFLKIIEILDEFDCQIAVLRDCSKLDFFKEKYPKIKFLVGDSGIIELVRYHEKGLVINALSGSFGLIPTIEAIKANKDIALANKESLVMAGDIINELLIKHNASLYPIDSEHSAIWQTIKGERKSDIKKIIITASGGAFRNLKRDELLAVTKSDALKHPNWQMGPKITIDSATMINKGFEIIEAHHLFKINYEQIEAVLHKESIVHGLTLFKDGSMKAILNRPTMIIAIAYALYYPQRALLAGNDDFYFNLSFEKIDMVRYPLLDLAIKVGKIGGLLPTVLNAANEAAVELFLNDRISFLEIESIVINEVEKFQNIANPSIEMIINVDNEVKKRVRRIVE